MSYAFVESDSAFLIVAFLFVVMSAYALIRSERSNHEQRTEELRSAELFLQEHFSCAERVAGDPATPDVIRDALKLFSVSVGKRDVARAIASSILSSQSRNTEPSANQIKFLKAIQDSVRDLQPHRSDLVQDFAVAVNSGVVAMMLRWPETRGAALRVVSKRSEPLSILREQSKNFVMSMPEACSEQEIPAVAA